MRRLCLTLAACIFATQASLAQIPSTLGWYAIPSTNLRSVCAPTPFNGYNLGNCANVTLAWNSGAVDTSRNRLIVWGGGHNDYFGNELYALSLNTLTITRLTDPGTPIATSCTDSIAGGTQPNARHTYGGFAYMANVDRLFVTGGALACGTGNEAPGNQVWTYNFAGSSWQAMNPTIVGNTPYAGGNGKTSAYDSVSGKVYFHDRLNLYSYTFSTNTVAQVSTDSAGDVGHSSTAVIDPVRRLYLIIGAGSVYSYDLSASSPTRVTRSTTGNTSIVAAGNPGVTYDSSQQLVVGWNGGSSVYTLNTSSWVWNAISTFTGGPSAVSNGTFGRFAYVPNLNLFVTLNSVDANASTFRMTQTQSDFSTRCAAAGVIKCIGFDSTSDFVNNVTVFPVSGTNTFLGTRDTTIKASGASSLKFTVPSLSSADVSGYYKVVFGQDFAEGQTFYVQWRQRFSPEILVPFAGTNGFKQHIFWHGTGGSCTDVQLVTNEHFQRNFPIMYTACGARGLWTQLPDGDFLLENGNFNCTNRADMPGEDNCAYYVPNQWITYYYQVSVGHWNQADTTVKAWIQYEGQQMKQWLSITNAMIENDSVLTKAFRQADLTPYMTGKDGSVSYPEAYTWYDEFILSTQPIAAPISVGDTTAPAAPTGVIVR